MKNPYQKIFYLGGKNFHTKNVLLVYLSVKPVEYHAQNLSLRIPRFKKMKIAKGTLNDELGKIKHTASKNEKSYYTWWIPEHTEPYKVFEVIDINKEDYTKT
jgi:hypothetical protein